MILKIPIIKVFSFSDVIVTLFLFCWKRTLVGTTSQS